MVSDASMTDLYKWKEFVIVFVLFLSKLSWMDESNSRDPSMETHTNERISKDADKTACNQAIANREFMRWINTAINFSSIANV